MHRFSFLKIYAGLIAFYAILTFFLLSLFGGFFTQHAQASQHHFFYTQNQQQAQDQGLSFLPSDLTTLDLWLDVSQLTGYTDGENVPTYNDYSGNNHLFEQTSGTAQAVYKTNIVNGKPVLRFDGGDYYQDTSYSTLPIHFFCVYYSTGTNNDEAVFGQDGDGGSAAKRTYLKARQAGSNIQAELNGANDVNISTSPILSSQWVLYELVLDSGNAELFINNVSKGTDTYSSIQGIGSDGSYVAASKFVGSVSDIFNGDIAEIIISDAVLSSGDQTSVRDYLNDKYNLGL